MFVWVFLPMVAAAARLDSFTYPSVWTAAAGGVVQPERSSRLRLTFAGEVSGPCFVAERLEVRHSAATAAIAARRDCLKAADDRQCRPIPGLFCENVANETRYDPPGADAGWPVPGGTAFLKPGVSLATFCDAWCADSRAVGPCAGGELTRELMSPHCDCVAPVPGLLLAGSLEAPADGPTPFWALAGEFPARVSGSSLRGGMFAEGFFPAEFEGLGVEWTAAGRCPGGSGPPETFAGAASFARPPAGETAEISAEISSEGGSRRVALWFLAGALAGAGCAGVLAAGAWRWRRTRRVRALWGKPTESSSDILPESPSEGFVLRRAIEKARLAMSADL